MIHSQDPASTFETTLLRHLRTVRFGRSMRYFEDTESTNTEAMMWANEGAPEGSLVLADYQTSGRGRQGRHWQAEPAKNLLISLILRPRIDASKWGLINIAASVAIVETLNTFIAPLSASIKWPNDIVIDGKKCCGMLIETITSGQHNTADAPLVLGIGINVNQASFPKEIETRATSLLLETGRHTSREELLCRLLELLENYYDAVQRGACTKLIDTYEQYLASLNQSCSFRFSEKQSVVHGVIRGISPAGALRFETADGEQLFHAGEVTTHLEASSHAGLS